MQRVYLAVRDLDWNTIPGTVDDLRLRADADGFDLSFTSRHASGAMRLSCSVEAHGDTDGIRYRLAATALSDFPYAKIGLCVHHPVPGFAGQRYRAETPVGDVAGQLPVVIAPQIHLADGTDEPLWDPFSAVELGHDSGGVVRIEGTGNLWEIEDQRNWTDANWKSASTPAYLGYHHTATEGMRIDQQLTITASGFTTRVAVSPSDPIELTIGPHDGRRLPAVGVCVGDLEAAEAAASAIGSLDLAHLRADVRPAELETTLSSLLSLAGRVGARLELALHLGADLSELDAFARVIGPHRDTIARVLVFRDGEESTAPETIAAARAAFGSIGAPIVTGTDVYFTQLNRHRLPTGGADGVAWPVTPQVHAFDDLSLMQTLQAQPDQVATVRSFLGDVPLHITPITLRPRYNAVAVTESADELMAAPDARQPTQFGAAWTLGTLAAYTHAGADSLTFFEATGLRGILDGQARTPAGEVLAWSAPLRGAPTRIVSGTDSRIAAICADADSGTVLLLANLTPDPLRVRIAGGGSLALEGYATSRQEVTP